MADVRGLLDIFLKPGNGPLPKGALADLLEITCGLNVDEKGKLASRASRERAISAAALLCSIAIAHFAERQNHAAEVEAWVLYLATVMACAERWKLPNGSYQNEFEVATQFIFESLNRLLRELKDRKSILEGDALFDAPFEIVRVRATWLLAAMSVLMLWEEHTQQNDGIAEFIYEFVRKHVKNCCFWGEGATPQFLAIYWYLRSTDATLVSDRFLLHVTREIVRDKAGACKSKIPGPYYSASEVLLHLNGIEGKSIDSSFEGSYSIEGLVHLVVRRNWKQEVKTLWPDFSQIVCRTFRPAKKWHFYRWRNPTGTNENVRQKERQEWDELKRVASDSNGESLPRIIKKHPIMLLLFLLVYPHRLNASAVRWLDDQLE